jgi:predicted AAA+ superfamily ATPase
MEILLTSQPTIEKPVDSILPHIALAVAEWKAENTEEKIKKTVIDLLEKESKQIVLKLLGFSESWGKWEVDHCNGRGGQSAAGDYLTKVQQEAIQEWLKGAVMPTLDKATKASMQKSAQQEYSYNLTRLVREYAVSQAERDAQTVIKQLVASDQVGSYLKAMALIESTN